MARALLQPPPSSTVARLLDATAAARALAPSAPPSGDAGASNAPTEPRAALQSPAIQRELTLTAATDATFTELIELYRRATGARLSSSHLARAILTGLAPCLPFLQREANRLGRLKLPSNARGREQERALFERRVARALIAGIRAAPAMDED